MAYLYLILAFIMNSCANIAVKSAAGHGFSFGDLIHARWNAGNAYIMLAAFLFAGNLAFYVLTLRTLPLSFAYPIMIGMTFLLTTLAAVMLGERVTALQIFGFVLIIGGILTVVISN